MSILLPSRLSPRPLLLIPINASPLPSSSSSSLSLPQTSFFRATIPRNPKPAPLPSAFPEPFSPSSSSSFSSSSHNAPSRRHNCNTRRASAGGGGGVGAWLAALKPKKRPGEFYPDIVKAGDPVLHEPARDVNAGEIASDAVQKTIDDMIRLMRKAPAVGLAAPQIGAPLRIIVIEDTKEYISYASKKEVEAQDRRPFDLLVIVNPKLKKKGNKTALFFEGCLSVDGFRAIVERHLEVEVTGLDREGHTIKVEASGWQARILQHECDHLDGTIYVDRMLPRTFRTIENLTLPLPAGCPELGPC